MDEIELSFVEREATPRLLITLGIQLHLAESSILNTVLVLEIFGVKYTRSTVHNWVHKAHLQPEFNQNSDHVAVDETVIRLNDEQYWLHIDVDPKTNKIRHTRHKPTTNTVLAHAFFAELREKHDVDNVAFLTDSSHLLKDVCQRHGLNYRYEKHGNRNSVEHIFQEIKRRTICFSTCFSNVEADTADN